MIKFITGILIIAAGISASVYLGFYVAVTNAFDSVSKIENMTYSQILFLGITAIVIEILAIICIWFGVVTGGGLITKAKRERDEKGN